MGTSRLVSFRMAGNGCLQLVFYFLGQWINEFLINRLLLIRFSRLLLESECLCIYGKFKDVRREAENTYHKLYEIIKV